MTDFSIHRRADRTLMARCIALSRQSFADGDLPFAAIVASDGAIVTQATNRAWRDHRVADHAEILAIADAQRKLTYAQMARATLYTSVEPCVMCAFCIREAAIGRVVYAIASPVMGGASKWNILGDQSLGQLIPQVFGPAPEIVAGLMSQEAEAVWQDWNPLAWQMILSRGLMSVPERGDVSTRTRHAPTLWHRARAALSSLRGIREPDTDPREDAR